MRDDKFDGMDENKDSRSWDFRELEDGEALRESLRRQRSERKEESAQNKQDGQDRRHLHRPKAMREKNRRQQIRTRAGVRRIRIRLRRKKSWR